MEGSGNHLHTIVFVHSTFLMVTLTQMMKMFPNLKMGYVSCATVQFHFLY
jgi:hypothetical protein